MDLVDRPAARGSSTSPTGPASGAAGGRRSPPCGRGRRARRRRGRRRGSSTRVSTTRSPIARRSPSLGEDLGLGQAAQDRPLDELHHVEGGVVDALVLAEADDRGDRDRRSPPSAETTRCSRAMSWAEPSRLPSGGRRSAQRRPPASRDPVGQVRVAAGDPLEGERRLGAGDVLGEPGFDAGAVDPVRGVPVASSPIAAQAYARRRGRRLSPSLANRLTIGFAIAFAVLTGLAVIGVARFLQQRQDYEDAIAALLPGGDRRPQPARARGTTRARRGPRIAAAGRTARALRDDIDGETRDTALLVGAGLIAGLTGAALLFSGLIASMRRPLEELVDASGRLAAGDLSARVKVGGLSETADARRRLQRDGRRAAAAGGRTRPARPDQRRVRPHRLARAAQPADLGPGLRRAADAGARAAHPQAGGDGRDHPRQHAATWSACSTTCSTWPAATPGG